MRLNTIIGVLMMLVLFVPVAEGSPALQGKWVTVINGQEFELILESNGTGSLAGQAFQYTVQGNKMQLQYANGSGEIVTWQMQGNTLKVTLQDGTLMQFQRKSGSSGAITSAGAAQASTGSAALFYYMRRDSQYSLSLCSYNPFSHKVGVLKRYNVSAVEPTRRGKDFVFAVKHATHPRITGNIGGKTFEIKMPPNMDIEVRHPSLSRDGKLLAFSVRSSKHVGNINMLDYSSGAYTGTYTAVGSWYKIVSINLRTGKQQAIYYDDALVPDVMKHRGLGPAFSPVQDIVAHANNYRIFLSQSYSGKQLKRIEVPTVHSGGWTGKALISEYSGLSFSPDGRYVAYLSQGEADIAVSPHMLILVDINTGSGSFLNIPNGYSAYSPLGLITLDFSPDGRYVVFSACRDDNNSTTFMIVADLKAGTFHMMNNSVNGISAVWKGR